VRDLLLGLFDLHSQLVNQALLASEDLKQEELLARIVEDDQQAPGEGREWRTKDDEELVGVLRDQFFAPDLLEVLLDDWLDL